MWGLPSYHAHRIDRKFHFQTLPWIAAVSSSNKIWGSKRLGCFMVTCIGTGEPVDRSHALKSFSQTSAWFVVPTWDQVVSCMAFVILHSCPTCKWACFKIVWPIKSPGNRSRRLMHFGGENIPHTEHKTDQAGKTTTQSAQSYVFWNSTHILWVPKQEEQIKYMRWWLGTHTSRSRESAGPQRWGLWMVLETNR